MGQMLRLIRRLDDDAYEQFENVVGPVTYPWTRGDSFPVAVFLRKKSKCLLEYE